MRAGASAPYMAVQYVQSYFWLVRTFAHVYKSPGGGCSPHPPRRAEPGTPPLARHVWLGGPPRHVTLPDARAASTTPGGWAAGGLGTVRLGTSRHQFPLVLAGGVAQIEEIPPPPQAAQGESHIFSSLLAEAQRNIVVVNRVVCKVAPRLFCFFKLGAMISHFLNVQGREIVEKNVGSSSAPVGEDPRHPCCQCTPRKNSCESNASCLCR